MDEIQKLKKELEFYKNKLSLGENDIAVQGYEAYVKIVRQQVNFLKDFDIKSNIDGKKAETVLYDRAMSMAESLPKMISSLNNLKLELKIEFNESEGIEKVKAVSPQSIGS